MIKRFIKKAAALAVAIAVISSAFSGMTVTEVKAAEAAPTVDPATIDPATLPWSTAKVYWNFNIDPTPHSFVDDGSVSTVWACLSQPGYNFCQCVDKTNNGTELNYQFLMPTAEGVLGYAGPNEEGYIYNNANGHSRMFIYKRNVGVEIPKHLWEYTREELLGAEDKDTYLDLADEGAVYRLTYCYDDGIVSDGTVSKGYKTYVEVKATGEVYICDFDQTEELYDENLILTVIYSFMPTKLQ